jgi:hypothetical protein
MLKHFEQHLLEQDWTQVASGVEVKLCSAPDGSPETFVLCRSTGRIEKDRAIREKQRARLATKLDKLKAQIDAPTRPLRKQSQAERRVGRLLEKYPRAARFFQVDITEVDDPTHASGKRLTMCIETQEERRDWAERCDGCYLLRTNLDSQNPATLWKTYIGLTQIEDCFRITKHDLGLRPVYHQKKERTQAHILVCFLGLVMWRTLQQWMSGCGLGTAPRKLLEEMAEVRSLDIVLPTGDANEIRLRTVSRPEQPLAILLQKLGLLLPNKPKAI